jgi:hypothetical protein
LRIQVINILGFSSIFLISGTGYIQDYYIKCKRRPYMHELSAILKVVVKPFKGFESLSRDKNCLKTGFITILFIGILYTITVIGLAIAKMPAIAPSALNITAENYYFYEAFFTLPLFLLLWLAVSGFVYLVALLLKAKTTFEKTAGSMAMALALPGFITWGVETVICGLLLAGMLAPAQWVEAVTKPGPANTFAIIYQLLAVGWYFILYPAAVIKSTGLKPAAGIPLALTAFIITAGVMGLFVR